MKVKIENRRDYELHVKKLVAKQTMSNKMKATVRKIVMQSFQDGTDFSQNNLSVEVME